jgi:hypothetical protein
MPPKKQLPEAPIIFALRFPVEDTGPQPANSGQESYSNLHHPSSSETTYSDILHDIETSYVTQRFTADTMKEILGRTKSASYGATTSCFWCCHPFPWKSSVIPVSYDAYENMYTCEGHFCCPECAMAYLYSDPSLSDISRWNRHALLVDLYRSLYKTRDLVPAPPRGTLRMFGGPLDIEQFREYTASSEEMVALHMPPLRLHVPTMNVQGPVRDVKKFVALSNETVEKAKGEMRLKRSKPVHNNVATLDKCMQQPTFASVV